MSHPQAIVKKLDRTEDYERLSREGDKLILTRESHDRWTFTTCVTGRKYSEESYRMTDVNEALAVARILMR